MVRYYLEIIGKQICRLIMQDEKGTYHVKTDGSVVFHEKIDGLWVKLPEWAEPREVSTSDKDYFEYSRRFERNSYMVSRPTEIREEEGTIKDIIDLVFSRGW